MNNRDKILDIAMNLNRIGNWAADGYIMKQKRIKVFLNQVSNYLASINQLSLPEPFKKTFDSFLKQFYVLEKESKETPKDTLLWAEKMMTWGNILTHRIKLIK